MKAVGIHTDDQHVEVKQLDRPSIESTTGVLVRMLEVGERAGNLGEMLTRAALFHEEDTARRVEWLTRLFGPLLMLFIGCAIGLIVVLMYLPIFQLAESIG